MPDYDFSRLSSRAFEQLVQALASEVIGPGIVVFGDGPDGGREATFEGQVPFPFDGARWDGYGVVQAKFKHRVSTDTQGAASDWAVAEFKKELERFSEKRRGLRCPDYYLFATNVVLTPVADKGGKDKLDTLFKQYQKKLGIREYRVWDYDQLRAFLDSKDGVRTSYAAWITAGDVLAAVLDSFNQQRPDFREVMRNFLQKELHAEQYVNLGQAGHSADDKTPLAKVFVDLPIANKTGETTEPKQSKRLLVSELLMVGSQRLDRESHSLCNRGMDVKGEQAGRVVIVGGPGQGKSTLTQFLCQLHRAAVLIQDGESSLTPEVRDALALIQRQCAIESISQPSVPRFPFRIDLSRFAAALAEQEQSVLEFLRRRISARTTRKLAPEDLRAWLRSYPWLLVLDGLDEVPASSNREQVLQAVHDFLIDANDCNADLLLVATTRPQGYHDDFSPRYYCHHQLALLDDAEAIRYATRLANERWANDQDTVERVMDMLRLAVRDTATARLMRSPLQVTIMTLLVEQGGIPPRERWRLFSDYYGVIYRREKQRPISSAELLSTYQSDINAIHQNLGLRLQMDSERSGGTDASLPIERFSDLVDDRLLAMGHEGERLRSLRARIINAALERLVFLVAPTDGAIGFEIRSLQEFMAAQQLTTGPDADIAARLRAIAAASHWRNVFLFAAGRCFYEREHLHDSIYTICAGLNEHEAELGDVDRFILTGSRLALELLEEGVLAQKPKLHRMFCGLSLRLIELPPCPEHIRLAHQYCETLDTNFKEALETTLGHSVQEKRLGAWNVLLQLIGAGVPWALALGKSHWPDATHAQFDILRGAMRANGGEWHLKRWLSLLPLLSPRNMPRWYTQSDTPLVLSLSWKKLPGWAKECVSRDYTVKRGQDIGVRLELNGLKSTGLRFILRNPLTKMYALVPDGFPLLNSDWERIGKVDRFIASPSRNSLAQCLRDMFLESDTLDVFGVYLYWLPWPLLAALHVVQNGTEADMLACRIASGECGDVADWIAAEERWMREGVTESDIGYQARLDLPFDRTIGKVGAPLFGMSMRFAHGANEQRTLDCLIELWRRLPKSTIRKSVADAIEFIGSVNDQKPRVILNLETHEIPLLLEDVRAVDVALLNALPESIWADVQSVSQIGASGKIGNLYPFGRSGTVTVGTQCQKLAMDNPYAGGIVRLFSHVCSAGHVPSWIPQVDLYSDPKERIAAVLVGVCAGRADERAMQVLREWVSMHCGAPGIDCRNAVREFIGLAHEHEIQGRTLEIVLETISKAIGPQCWKERVEVMEALVAAQRRRLSSISAYV